MEENAVFKRQVTSEKVHLQSQKKQTPFPPVASNTTQGVGRQGKGSPLSAWPRKRTLYMPTSHSDHSAGPFSWCVSHTNEVARSSLHFHRLKSVAVYTDPAGIELIDFFFPFFEFCSLAQKV